MSEIKINSFKIISKHFGPVFFRNAVSLITIIISLIIFLLFFFKEFQEGLFMSSVLFLNVVIGTIQDLRAKLALEKLQALLVTKVTRLDLKNNETTIDLEQIKIGDRLKIKLGDQIPADSLVLRTNGLEVNESLLTGESDNIIKKEGDKLFAGSFVTAGFAIIEVTVLPNNSFVGQMTKKIKRYRLSLSPIQRAIATFIKYMTYLLIVLAAFVVIRGIVTDEILVVIVIQIAALTGTIVPEGLILATTLLFAYGAIRLFKSQVLLQEINAAEKLGQIKNLCIDKTGTLTENQPTLENILVYKNYSKATAEQLADGYIKANEDNTQTTLAVSNELKNRFLGKIIANLPFSSERKYGAAVLQIEAETKTVVMGAPDILIDFIKDDSAKAWLSELIELYSNQAKRLLLLAVTKEKLAGNILPAGSLQIVALFILANPLKKGTKQIIDFFQNRGVAIRVISGDNLKTVQAIAKQAGIKNSNLAITGAQMADWQKEDFRHKAGQYYIFARIKPEQKEKLVEVFRQTGFTAMVGDGANDALAIKKSDLGIAMFDGASATKQIAEIVLMNNSFSALPKGVIMADSIIVTIELVASIFFNKVVAGLTLFTLVSLFAFNYPLTPRNMTVINYFTIGLPIFYWSIFPAQKKRMTNEESFLKKILPYSVLNGLLTALACFIAFKISLESLGVDDANVIVVLVLIAMSFWFFVNVPSSLGVKVPANQKKLLVLIGLVEILALTLILRSDFLIHFFDLYQPPFRLLMEVVLIILAFGWLQYILPRYLFDRKIFKRKQK
ncbi:MAG: HAD-IC family P-type ATPase [Candidatus Buchananbacteria bacterium]